MGRVLWVVLVATALSGCVDTSQPGDDGGAAPTQGDDPAMRPRAPIMIELPDCAVVEAFTAVDAAAARTHVPEGFEPLVQDARTPVVFGALVCRGDSLDTERVFLAIMVTPTHDALLAEGDTNYFWEPEHLVSEATGYGQTVRSLGGNLSVLDSLVLDTDFQSASFRAEFANGAHAVTATGAMPPGPLSQAFGHFREYSGADGGYTYLEATYGNTASSSAGAAVATVTTAAGTPARDLLGESITTTTLYGSGIPYDDASLGFVAWPPE